MVFESLEAFWQMNGHGPFVWSSYFAVLLVFVFLTLQSVVARRRVVIEIRGMLRREEAIAEGKMVNESASLEASGSEGEPK